MISMPLSLSDGQLDKVIATANALPLPLRDTFLQQAAALLGGKGDPGDDQVWRACKTAQAAVFRGSAGLSK
jgi:hypothetical protein